jgi:hypothetical protein
MYKNIINFLKELHILGIQNPGKGGFGNATSTLMDAMVEMGLFNFVDQMEKDAAICITNEYRLNNAGLKMLCTWDLSTNEFLIAIGGDQYDYYPEFINKAMDLIASCDWIGFKT